MVIILEQQEPKYSDVKEISEDEFANKVKDFEQTHCFKNHCRDGIFVVWGKTYSYRAIDYRIIMVRYFQVGKTIPKPNWLNGYGRWLILECPESSGDVIKIYDKIYGDSVPFLNRNLSDYTDITLEQQFEMLVKQAKTDIDIFWDNSMSELNSQIKKLEEIKQEFHVYRYLKTGIDG